MLLLGPTGVGKTLLAQTLLEKYHYPYVSIDHLKMSLIRSKNTKLTPYSSDQDLTNYLWPIVREMIKTSIENDQNLIIEGCYIPFDWKKDFNDEELSCIKYYCLIMSENYIKNNSDKILSYGSIIEHRLDESININDLIDENKHNLENCIKHNLDYILIDKDYKINIE